MKKWVVILIAILIVSAIVVFKVSRTVESKIEGFPFDLSPFYKLAIQLEGWKETGSEGHMRAYEKDGREVILIKYPGEDAIYIFE